MAREIRILGLEAYQMSSSALSRLGDRRVRFSVQLKGLKLSGLLSLRPKERDLKLRAALKRQFHRLVQRFPDACLTSRDERRGSWTLDGMLPASKVRVFASSPEVQDLTIQSIQGRRRMASRPALAWFCVRGAVAIQIEGRTKGQVDIEDRFVLVKAYDATDARQRLRQQWSEYAKPYLNPYGYLVRWKLISVVDVYALTEDDLDPRGTEVYSRLRQDRMKPEYQWLPRNK